MHIFQVVTVPVHLLFAAVFSAAAAGLLLQNTGVAPAVDAHVGTALARYVSCILIRCIEYICIVRTRAFSWPSEYSMDTSTAGRNRHDAVCGGKQNFHPAGTMIKRMEAGQGRVFLLY